MGKMLAGLCYAVLFAAAGESTPITLTANEHPWARFLPKSWCIVETVTTSYIDGRAVRSSQKVRTTLEAVGENDAALQELETLEIGGRIVEKQPQIIKYDFYQEPVQENVRIRQGTPEKLAFEKKTVPCAVRIYEQKTAGGHQTVTIWYTPLVYPYVLRVEKIVRSVPGGENAGGQIIKSSVTAVQETSALKTLRSSRRNRTYSVQTVEKTGNITTITDAQCSWDVPGGMLTSTTRELDAQNREIRRSTSRMTNFYSHEMFPIPSSSRTWVVPAVPVETVR